ncbi:hypothetical protein BCR33DRAFT_713651, partial [Rhizoclosmatium globosum]
MTWERYCSWIQTTFGSQLTLTQAIEAMENLNQSKSATLYSAQFNELISAIAAAGVTYDVKHLCVKYLQGLKLHLRTMPELFRITDNLDRLQQEAEKLDDLMFRHGKRTSNNGNNNAHQKSPRQYGNFPRRSSMPSFQSSFPNASPMTRWTSPTLNSSSVLHLDFVASVPKKRPSTAPKVGVPIASPNTTTPTTVRSN